MNNVNTNNRRLLGTHGTVANTSFQRDRYSKGRNICSGKKVISLKNVEDMWLVRCLFPKGKKYCLFTGTPVALSSAWSRRWIWGDTMCDLEAFTVYFLGMSSMYIIMAIAFDRYIAITKPLLGSKITKDAAYISCGTFLLQDLANTFLLSFSFI